MQLRQIAKPIPMPPGRLDRNGSKMVTRRSGGTPGPVSRISTATAWAVAHHNSDVAISRHLCHGLSGVDHQVDEDLLDQNWIDQCERQVVIHGEVDHGSLTS